MKWRPKQNRRVPAGCCRRRAGCLVAVILLMLLAAALLVWGGWASQAAAQSASGSPIWLLIDNSDSMSELGGVGSDPEGLRFEAAKLFIAYLSETVPNHQVGIIFFGSEPEVIAELTSLKNISERQALSNKLTSTELLGWTNPLAAIELAESLTSTTGAPPVLDLLPDGKPELNDPSFDAERYQKALLAKSQQLTQKNIPLFTIQLVNEATTQDVEIQTVWQPLWEGLSEAVAPCQVYLAT